MQKSDSKKKVLVVDDEEQLLVLFKNILELENFNVLTAVSCDEALMLLNTNKVDIILSDIRMPVHDGLYLFSKVKEMQLEVDFYMISGDSEISQDEIKKLGVIDLFKKPEGFNLFVQKIKDY